jgi:hypothetical protein
VFSGLPLKLIGIGVGALAMIAAALAINGWRVERNELRAWQVSVVTAASGAAGNPKLKAKDVSTQIRLLGQSVADLKAALARQNAAVEAMAAASAKARQEAEKAVSSSKERAKVAQTTADRLKASASASRIEKGSCDPSKTLQESWR